MNNTLSVGNASDYDMCSLTNVKAYINSVEYPYENYNESFDKNMFTMFYQDYADFQKHYYQRSTAQPYLSREQYKNIDPFICIDCFNKIYNFFFLNYLWNEFFLLQLQHPKFRQLRTRKPFDLSDKITLNRRITVYNRRTNWDQFVVDFQYELGRLFSGRHMIQVKICFKKPGDLIQLVHHWLDVRNFLINTRVDTRFQVLEC